MASDEKISKEEVEYVAHLARLELSDKEKEEMTRTLNDILVYMEKLSELDTTDVEPMTHAIPKENVMRPDEIKPYEATDEILKNAPEVKGKLFKVPKVIE
jgi:aspartyl-tRNA(Asn)/glutamyl-tRNA(Gln) amidotransferase subunit C